MRAFNLLFCALLSNSLAIPALGKGLSAPEIGIWSGTLGKNRILACFSPGQSAYFYLRHAKLIPLISHPNDKSQWIESDPKHPTGLWAVKAEGNQLRGDWSDTAKTRSLPIELMRYQTLIPNSDTGCDPELGVFNPDSYAKVLAEKVSVTGTKKVMGKSYQVISGLSGDVSSVKLLDQEKSVADLNLLLSTELRTGISQHYDCFQLAKESIGEGGADYHFGVEPLFWNERWISFAESTDGYCGGAHPFAEFSYVTWDLTSGKRINLWHWIKNSKKPDSAMEYGDHYFNYAAPEALNQKITAKAIKQRGIGDECQDVIRENHEYQIRFGHQGFVFTPSFPHVTLACTEDVELSFKALMPFLTKEAAEAVTQHRYQN